MLLQAVAPASARNRLVKALNRLQPSHDRCLGLRFAAERLSASLKTAGYPYDALDDALFQRQLQSWFRNIPRTCLPELLGLCASPWCATLRAGASRCLVG